MRQWALVAVVLAAAMIVLPAVGQWSSTEPVNEEQLRAMREEYISSRDKAVSLSGEQKKKMNAIFDARDRALREFQAKNAGKMKKFDQALRDAQAAGDDKTYSKILDEIQKFSEPMREILMHATSDLANVLTEKQKVAWRAAILVKTANEAIAPLTLNEEQVEKLKAAFPYLLAYNESFSTYGLARGELWDRIIAKTRSLLTDEQKAQLIKIRTLDAVETRFAGADLDGERRKQLEDAYDEAKKAGLAAREIKDKLAEKAVGLIEAGRKDRLLASHLAMQYNTTDFGPGVTLSDEQKSHLQAAREKRRKVPDTVRTVGSDEDRKIFAAFLGTLSADQKDRMLLRLTGSVYIIGDDWPAVRFDEEE